MPARAAVGGVVQPLVACVGLCRIRHYALVGLRHRRYHQLRIHRAPRKAGKALPGKRIVLNPQALLHVRRGLNQAPGVAPVERPQYPRAVVGIERIVGVARAGQNHSRAARLYSNRTDADRGVHRAAQRRRRIRERRKQHIGRQRGARILRQPHPAPGSPQVEPVPRRIRRVQRHRRHPPRHQAVVSRGHGRRTQRLPTGGCRRLRSRPHRRRAHPHRSRACLNCSLLCCCRLTRRPPAPGQKPLRRHHARRQLLHLRRPPLVCSLCQPRPRGECRRQSKRQPRYRGRSPGRRPAPPCQGHTPARAAHQGSPVALVFNCPRRHTRPGSGSRLPSHIIRGGLERYPMDYVTRNMQFPGLELWPIIELPI